MTEHKYTPIENKKPVEIIHELKGDEYQIPTFEEFMKTYENDGSLNYTDLEHSDMGESKGYGPITERAATRVFNGTIVVDEDFCLNVKCLNYRGRGLERPVTSISAALHLAHQLEDGYWPGVSNEVERKCAVLIREAVAHRRAGNRVHGYVRVKGQFWGSPEWSYSY